jgi:hypothetical protein
MEGSRLRSQILIGVQAAITSIILIGGLSDIGIAVPSQAVSSPLTHVQSQQIGNDLSPSSSFSFIKHGNEKLEKEILVLQLRQGKEPERLLKIQPHSLPQDAIKTVSTGLIKRQYSLP